MNNRNVWSLRSFLLSSSKGRRKETKSYAHRVRHIKKQFFSINVNEHKQMMEKNKEREDDTC